MHIPMPLQSLPLVKNREEAPKHFNVMVPKENVSSNRPDVFKAPHSGSSVSSTSANKALSLSDPAASGTNTTAALLPMLQKLSFNLK